MLLYWWRPFLGLEKIQKNTCRQDSLSKIDRRIPVSTHLYPSIKKTSQIPDSNAQKSRQFKKKPLRNFFFGFCLFYTVHTVVLKTISFVFLFENARYKTKVTNAIFKQVFDYASKKPQELWMFVYKLWCLNTACLRLPGGLYLHNFIAQLL